MSPARPRALAVVVIVALVFGVTGCSRDTASDEVRVAGSASTDSDDKPAGGDVTVTAVDYDYQGLPATVAAGTRIVLHNDSSAELHELIAFRLADSEERTVGDLLELPEEELGAALAGEPATVILAPPTGDGFAVVGDGSLSEPGRYALLCAIPTGADPQAYLDAPEGDGPPQVDGGPPHFTSGMWAEIQVE